MSLQNQCVLIVGGTSGIGLGVAKAVAERGGTPVVASRLQSSVDGALGVQAYLYCIEQKFSTGAVIKVDGGSVLV